MQTCVIGKQTHGGRKERVVVGEGEGVTLMGVMNMSPDSFYAGSYVRPEELESRAQEMVALGAEVLDIGGQSTAPHAPYTDSATELERVISALKILSNSDIPVPVSVDTCNPVVLEAALHYDIDLINDVSGLISSDYGTLAADSGCAVIAMAAKTRPGDPKTFSGTMHALDMLCARMEQYEIDNYILDPGVGRWIPERTPDIDLELCYRFKELVVYERPLLAAISRKSFLGEIVGCPAEKRLSATLAMTSWLIFQGASMIRAHDIAETKDVIAVCSKMQQNQAERNR
ncbi:MAG: dihydropteroate synthase [Euryarchaeota archaeon]|nr:dihydropteroate synthase [Euryarchaeota archaeon]